MENFIKVGISVMILNGNKILLGHRSKNKKDELLKLQVLSSLFFNKISTFTCYRGMFNEFYDFN